MKMAKHCIVKGRVQGVYFRQGTANQARELGITGWVRNLPSGDVECLICGEEKNLERMIDWLRKGPPAAKVIELQVNDHAVEEHAEFRILR